MSSIFKDGNTIRQHKPRADTEAEAARPALLSRDPRRHLPSQWTSTCRGTRHLPAAPGTPRASPPGARSLAWRRREQRLSLSRPSELGKGVAFPFGTHPSSPPPRPPRSGARNSALAEPRAPGHWRARRTRAERGSGERFLGRLRSSGRPPHPPGDSGHRRERRCGRPGETRTWIGCSRQRGWDSLSHWFVPRTTRRQVEFSWT